MVHRLLNMLLVYDLLVMTGTAYFQRIVVGDISLDDVDIGPNSQLIADLFISRGLITNKPDYSVALVCRYLTQKFELIL